MLSITFRNYSLWDLTREERREREIRRKGGRKEGLKKKNPTCPSNLVKLIFTWFIKDKWHSHCVWPMLCPWVMEAAKETLPDSYCLATRQQNQVLQAPCDQKGTDASFVRLSRPLAARNPRSFISHSLQSEGAHHWGPEGLLPARNERMPRSPA